MIEISVVDRRTFKDAVIGEYTFDCSYIYNQENHCIEHQWIALSDPNDANFSDVTGYLKISASVAHEADKQIELGEDDSAGSESIMMPP